MAKPGSGAARRISNGGSAVDLSLAAMSDEQAREVQEILELKSGVRCRGCGKRLTVGFHFTSLDPRDAEEPIVRMAACAREECDFAEQARQGATFVEAVEYAWPDGNDPEMEPCAKVLSVLVGRPKAEVPSD